jgi:hypothetical protein
MGPLSTVSSEDVLDESFVLQYYAATWDVALTNEKSIFH